MEKDQKEGKMKNIMIRCNGFMKRVWKDNSFLLKPFLVILAIYLVGVSAIILAGVHYADDVARTNYGYAEWAGFSRYISTIVSHGLHGDWYLTNIAPFPQLLAVVLFAVASVFFVIVVAGKECLRQKWTKWIWAMVAVVPLVLSPYMLECLSYQYDAPYMALSVLFVIAPLLLWRKNRWAFGGAIMAGILIVCMTYQAAIGIFPMLVLFMAMREWSKKEMKNKEIIKFFLFSMVIFVLTMVIFQKFMMRPREAYASNSLPGIGEFLPSLVDHLMQYFELIVGDLRLFWKILIIVISMMFIGIFAARSKRNKIVAGVVGAVGVISMAVATLVIYAALDRPLYAPRAMYAIGAFIAVISVYVAYGEYSNIATKIPVVVLGYCFVTFALTYGNALKEQNEFRNSRIDMVANDLNHLPEMMTEGVKTIQIDGEIGLSPVIRHMPIEDYRVLYRLMMPSFSDNVPWMEYKLTQGRWFDNIYYDPGTDLKEANLPLLKDTVLYEIYGNDEAILVKFKNDVRYDLKF